MVIVLLVEVIGAGMVVPVRVARSGDEVDEPSYT